MQPWPAGTGREVLAEVDSTNAEALRRAAAGATGPLWLLAARQTAPRGRRGRPWTAPPGHFAATLLMTPPGGPTEAALRSFAAALALRDALQELAGPAARFSLKWPNDVLLAERKLAGILLETAGPPLRLAIGFGVNLAEAPDPASLEGTAMLPISLAAVTDRPVSPEALLDRLARAYARWEATLAAEGFAPVRAAWLASAARLGTEVTARLPRHAVTGTFETIDATGALVLATPLGRITLPAAEVHFAQDVPAPGPIPGDLPGTPPPPPGPDLPDPGPIDPPSPDLPPSPETPPSPDTPPTPPPVEDPPAPDTPPEHPLVEDPPAPDVPPELPPEQPPEVPPAPPTELPTVQPSAPPLTMAHAPRD